MARRVVVTGMGAVSSLGLTVGDTWNNAIEGVSGVGPITHFDASGFLVQDACEVKDFDPRRVMDARQARRLDRYEQFALVACMEAVSQSGLELETEDPDRIAVVVSTAVGGMSAFEGGVRVLVEHGPRRLSPFMIPMFMPNGAAGLIAIELGARGPCYSVASACASALDAIGNAWNLIRHGSVDITITGGAEATITPLGIAAFDRLGALSRRRGENGKAPSPFDKNRDGFMMGEGGAILVMESLEHAKGRGAVILAELSGYASTADAFHVTAPASSGEGSAAAMRGAMQAAGLNEGEVDYINAHGTGTLLNDQAETRAVKAALGDHAWSTPVSSTKSMTGHIMGATGALETIFCVQAIREGMLPPTINFKTPDPECDLDYVPNKAREHKVHAALNNAFGFGGHNAVLALREF